MLSHYYLHYNHCIYSYCCYIFLLWLKTHYLTSIDWKKYHYLLPPNKGLLVLFQSFFFLQPLPISKQPRKRPSTLRKGNKKAKRRPYMARYKSSGTAMYMKLYWQLIYPKISYWWRWKKIQRNIKIQRRFFYAVV